MNDKYNEMKKLLDEKLELLDELLEQIEKDNVVYNEIMTLGELCRYIKLDERAIMDLKYRRKIPFYEKDNRTYFYKDDIDEWLKKKNTEGIC